MRNKETGWTYQDKGWYTHPRLGGIAQERNKKWYWYPRNADTTHPLYDRTMRRIGPYLTLTETLQETEKRNA